MDIDIQCGKLLNLRCDIGEDKTVTIMLYASSIWCPGIKLHSLRVHCING